MIAAQRAGFGVALPPVPPAGRAVTKPRVAELCGVVEARLPAGAAAALLAAAQARRLPGVVDANLEMREGGA